jgi:hypothetical protein
MNVLRDFVTDTWGTSFGVSPMIPGDELSESFTATWNTSWIKANTAAVV